MSTIKNVVFDLGGVLVDLDIEQCREAFRTLGMPQVAQIINPYHPAEMIGRLESGAITFGETCDEMRTLCARPEITDEQIAWAYGEFLLGAPVEKMRQIAALRRAGLRTYVLSNNNPSSMVFIRRMFEADGHTMDDYFDKMYLSYQMKMLKPSPEIFRAMAADAGMKPAETLFIDDSKTNADAAHGLGFAVYMPAPGEDFSHLFGPILK